MNRPTSVTVFGVLNLVFAALGLLSALMGLVMFAAAAVNSSNPISQVIHDNPTFALWMKVCTALNLVVSAVLLAAGIGLLQLKSWARKVSIGYAIYSMIMLVVGTVVNYFFVFMPLLEKAHLEQGPEAAASIGAMVGAMVGSCFGIIYPILLLIFMFRPKVVAAFGPPAPVASPQPPPPIAGQV